MALPLFLTRLLIRTGLPRFLPSVRRRIDGAGDFLRYYSDRVLAAPLDPLGEVLPLLEPLNADVLDLTPGAPRFDLVPSASTKLPADRRGWPPPHGLPELRGAVAEKLLSHHGLAVNPADEVLVTAGAAGAFSTVLDTFVNPGDAVVLFDPTSPLFGLMAKQRGARLRWVRTATEGGRLRPRLDHLDRMLCGAKLLVVASPGNPTGGVLAAEDLEQVAWWADRRDVLICSDEVFARFCYEDRPASVGALPRARRRTLTLGSVSKSHALAALRVGWLAGHRHLVRACALTAGLQTPFVPTVCQQTALAALRQPDEAFEPIRQEFAARRRYAFERLEAMGLKPAWPAGAFFLWLPVAGLSLGGRAFADRLLRSKKVRVTPGELFGPSGAGHVRLSYAVEDGRLREALSRLAELVRELKPGSPRAARGSAVAAA